MTHKLFYVNILDSENICIESLSFSTCGNYLAVSYSNNISIYEIKSRFHLKTLTDPDVDASFRSTIWVPFSHLKCTKLVDYRLFSIGLHGIIAEWDLRVFKQKRTITSFGGAIFSGVVSPFSDLMITCDDGAVRSFTMWAQKRDSNHGERDVEELVFNKVLVKHSCSILSICCSKENFFCGTANSEILVCTYGSRNYKTMKVSNAQGATGKRPHDSSSGAAEGGSSTGAATSGGGGNCNIWSLVYVEDKKALITGDSLGNVTVWDLSTLTMLQTFSDVRNDVIALELINSNLFISASLQGKVVVYSYNRGTARDPGGFGAGPGSAATSGTADGSGEDESKSTGHVYVSSSIGGNTGGSKEGKWFINGFKYPLKGSIHCLSIYSTNASMNSFGDGGGGANVGDDVGFLVCGGDFGCIYYTKTHKFLNKKTCKLIYPALNSFNSRVQMNTDKSKLISQHAHDVNVWSLSSTAEPTPSDTTGGANGQNTPSKGEGAVNRSSTSSTISTSTRSTNSVLEKSSNRLVDESSNSVAEDSTSVGRDISKLCLIKLNKEGGRILESHMSPSGDVLAVLNEAGVRILLLDNLKISQVKFSYNHVQIITMCFLSDAELLVHYHESASRNYHIAKYSIREGTMETLEYLDMNEGVVKMAVLGGGSGSDNETTGTENTGSETTESGDTSGSSGRNWGILYGLNNNTYCVDFRNRTYVKLPQIVGARIVSVAVNGGHLLAFSSSFKYYIYDLERKIMVDHGGELIQKIPSKVTNVNSVIVESHWVLSWVIVQTTHNIFYFKLNISPEGEAETSTPTKGGGKSSNIATSVAAISSLLNGGIASMAGMAGNGPGATTAMGTAASVNESAGAISAAGRIVGGSGTGHGSGGVKPSKLIVGPRRLYNFPSIEHYVYPGTDVVAAISSGTANGATSAGASGANATTAGAAGTSQDANAKTSTDRSTDIELADAGSTKINYVNLAKSKFIVHSDVLVSAATGEGGEAVDVSIIAFRRAARDEFVRPKKYGQ